ncbi:Lrp/AsnC ligand binding domain-containing protein [Aestuariivirga sp.]|uniref:Lrp/AsnC ligand binding domain-containing protein n=1 Tax=Aestuariivirga sp. TaxID=2650926 RepID=UPI0039E48844
MSGQFDYLLRVVAEDAADYERIHRGKISRLPGVQRIQSALALRTIKPWAGYPVG